MYANLKGELSKRNIQQISLAHALGLHENTITNKLSGKSSFSIEEAFFIKSIFFPQENISLEFLFARNQAV